MKTNVDSKTVATPHIKSVGRSPLRFGLPLKSLAIASVLLAALMAFFPIRMQATSIEALNFTSTSDEVFPGYTVGWAFNVSAPITVTSLGWFDDQDALGFAFDHAVGIFSAAGDLLVSATVTTVDPLTASTGSQPGFGFRYHPITPFTLQPGSYVIGGLNPLGTTDGFYDFGSGVTTATGITYVEGRFVGCCTLVLTYPNTPADRGISYFGPNFQFTPTPSYAAQVQQPINADGTSVFNVRRGVVPVKFTLTQDGVATCDLPPATIAVTRTAGGTTGPIDESIYTGPADTGSNFRIGSCQYIYNLSASALGVDTYRVDIKINDQVVGSAFQLK
jgi:hypothetical protein